MPTKKTKKTTPDKHKAFLNLRVEKVNQIINRLEGEVERAVKKLISKGEKSSKEMLRTFDEMLEWIKNGQIYAIASGTKDSLEAEIAKVKKETLSRVREFESIASKTIFSEVKNDLATLIDRVNGSSLVDTVKSQAEKSRNQLFEVLHIPDQRQVEQVASRVARLEKKIQSLSKKAA